MMRTKFLILMLLMVMMPIGGVYAWVGNDRTDRLSNDQAGIFSPGYLNAAKQQAYSIVNQNNKTRSWWENLVDKVKDKVSEKVEEHAATKVQPEVKKKTSAKVASNTSSVNVITTASSYYNVDVGSGTEQRNAQGKLVSLDGGQICSEMINNVLHVYAGTAGNTFVDSSGNAAGYTSLQAAINYANTAGGGYVLARGGQDSNGNAITYNGAVNLNDTVIGRGSFARAADNSNFIRLYGGYDEHGVRDIAGHVSTVNGAITAHNMISESEINGFKVIAPNPGINGFTSGIIVMLSSNVSVLNNTVTGFGTGIQVSGSSNVDIRQNILSSSRCGVLVTTVVTNPAVLYDPGITSNAVTITNNTFSSGGTQYSVRSYAGSSVSSQYNNFYGTYSLDANGAGSVISSVGDYFAEFGSNPIVSVSGSSQTLGGYISSQNQRGYNDPNDTTSRAFDTSITYSESVTLRTNSEIESSSFSSNYHSNISNSNIYGTYNSSPYETLTNLLGNPLTQDNISNIFKGLLANKNELQAGMTTPLNEALVGRLVTDTLSSTVGVPSLTATESRIPEMQLAMALANILRNPTADQKAVLDAVEMLLADMDNINEKAGANPELNKAESDLLQMVAAVLLAQGVPDLLKAGDIEGVKGIFKDLGQSKDKIMLDYTQSIKPYYNSIIKDLSTNLAMLQLKGILSKKITEEELKNLEPREIDRILESIRKSNDKSFELSYILQQDAKYRKEYLDPQNKALEEAMKAMMGSFTARLNKALEDKR